MFAEIIADVYLLVDGDSTYDSQAAKSMVEKLCHEQLDMVVGVRKTVGTEGQAYRFGHQLGNHVFTGLIHFFFGTAFTDVFLATELFPIAL